MTVAEAGSNLVNLLVRCLHFLCYKDRVSNNAFRSDNKEEYIL